MASLQCIVCVIAIVKFGTVLCQSNDSTTNTVPNDPKIVNINKTALNAPPYNVSPPYAQTNNNSTSQPVFMGSCDLLTDHIHYQEVKDLFEADSKLIKYRISFPEYKATNMSDPCLDNLGYYYKMNSWYRVFDKHGRTLLKLSFNYDVLSLKMLDFGVAKMDIEFRDSPKFCFSELDPEAKVSKLREVLINDFAKGDDPIIGSDHSVCYQKVVGDNGYARFSYECCQKDHLYSTDNVTCTDDVPDGWINLLFAIVGGAKFYILLFAPLLIRKFVQRRSTKHMRYALDLGDDDKKLLHISKLNQKIYDDNEDEQLKANVNEINVKKVFIEVDHDLLMNPSAPPAGFFYFMIRFILRCGILRYEPLKSCSAAGFLGSSNRKCLWWDLPFRKSIHAKAFTKKFNIGIFIKIIGGLIILALLPLPYYFRVACFYIWEEPEINLRKEAMERLNLKVILDYNLFQNMSPTHGYALFAYLFYAVSLILVAFAKFIYPDLFDDLVLGAIRDQKNVSRRECVRLFLAHIVLPFEKCGCLGFIVGLVYWPIMLPLALVVIAMYYIPLVYLTGRFIWPRRPPVCSNFPHKTQQDEGFYRDYLSNGVTSLESLFLLQYISQNHSNEQRRPLPCTRTKTRMISLILGVLCIIVMYSLTLMYAETLGFFVEMLGLTMMGAIVNAGSAAKYIMLIFWIFMYSANCYNNEYAKYVTLTSKLFSFIKAKLDDDVKGVILHTTDKQQNYAFKFFRNDVSYFEDDVILRGHRRAQVMEAIMSKPGLYLCSSSLIFFVDQRDTCWIPKRLFEQICNIEAPGCPGPVYKSVLRATNQLIGMITFLFFVMVVIMAFGNIYDISSTNQLLVTLAGGFLPFVINKILMPAKIEINVNTYLFEGKLHQLIRNFSQEWLVYGMESDNIIYDVEPLNGGNVESESGVNMESDIQKSEVNKDSEPGSTVDGVVFKDFKEPRQNSPNGSPVTQVSVSGYQPVFNQDVMKRDWIIESRVLQRNRYFEGELGSIIIDKAADV